MPTRKAAPEPTQIKLSKREHKPSMRFLESKEFVAPPKVVSAKKPSPVIPQKRSHSKVARSAVKEEEPMLDMTIGLQAPVKKAPKHHDKPRAPEPSPRLSRHTPRAAPIVSEKPKSKSKAEPVSVSKPAPKAVAKPVISDPFKGRLSNPFGFGMVADLPEEPVRVNKREAKAATKKPATPPAPAPKDHVARAKTQKFQKRDRQESPSTVFKPAPKPAPAKQVSSLFGLFDNGNPFKAKKSKTLIATPSKFEIRSSAPKRNSTTRSSSAAKPAAAKKVSGVRSKLKAVTAIKSTAREAPKVSQKSKKIDKVVIKALLQKKLIQDKRATDRKTREAAKKQKTRGDETAKKTAKIEKVSQLKTVMKDKKKKAQESLAKKASGQKRSSNQFGLGLN